MSPILRKKYGYFALLKLAYCLYPYNLKTSTQPRLYYTDYNSCKYDYDALNDKNSKPIHCKWKIFKYLIIPGD